MTLRRDKGNHFTDLSYPGWARQKNGPGIDIRLLFMVLFTMALQKTKKKDSLPVNVTKNSKFAFLTQVIGLKSLHYGYWHQDQGNALCLEDVRTAQGRYTDTLIDFIPQDVNTILDVGCGIGDVSFRLAQQGYDVTAISPDKNHKAFFDGSNNGVLFHNTKFEDFAANRRFDLILMSESQNYFDTDVGFKQCSKYLKPGGYLLVSGMFRKTHVEEFEKVRNVEEDYIRKAESYKLKLTKFLDITKNVLPTLEYCHQGYKKYILPTLDIIYDYFGISTKIKLNLLKFFFAKEINRFLKTKDYYEERFDPELFQQHVKYLRLLFVHE